IKQGALHTCMKGSTRIVVGIPEWPNTFGQRLGGIYVAGEEEIGNVTMHFQRGCTEQRVIKKRENKRDKSEKNPPMLTRGWCGELLGIAHVQGDFSGSAGSMGMGNTIRFSPVVREKAMSVYGNYSPNSMATISQV